MKEIKVTLESDVYDWIKRSAELNGLSISEMAEEMLNDVVAEHKDARDDY